MFQVIAAFVSGVIVGAAVLEAYYRNSAVPKPHVRKEVRLRVMEAANTGLLENGGVEDCSLQDMRDRRDVHLLVSRRYAELIRERRARNRNLTGPVRPSIRKDNA